MYKCRRADSSLHLRSRRPGSCIDAHRGRIFPKVTFIFSHSHFSPILGLYNFCNFPKNNNKKNLNPKEMRIFGKIQKHSTTMCTYTGNDLPLPGPFVIKTLERIDRYITF